MYFSSIYTNLSKFSFSVSTFFLPDIFIRENEIEVPGKLSKTGLNYILSEVY